MAESKRQLAGALEQLMEQKPLDQVRVSEIVALAGVSKQTFYHHFTDKYHLMEYCFRDMFSQQFDRMATLAPFGECYLDFLTQCRQRKNVFAQRIHLARREQLVPCDAPRAARRLWQARARVRRGG